MKDKLVKQFIDKREILRVFNLINLNRIIKTSHFYDRLLFRNLDEKFVDGILHKKDKIVLVDKKIHIKGDVGYDLYYKLDDFKTLKLCFIINFNKSLLVNAILMHRRWQGSIKLLD